MYNILTDDIIRFGAGGEIKPASLPEACAALMRDEVESFPSLRPHQRHAWHAFTVQLGAMALHRAGLAEPPTDAETWREIIRGLTPDFPDDEPWRLVVDDITKPAFMQPPATSEKKIADYKSVVGTPDELDMLVTSKNHDLKSSVADSGGAGDWLFALISLQTSEGYPGAGNYGISRMNGGLGNRPAFSLTPSTRHGAHARRDIAALLEYRERLLDDYPMRDENGVDLLWVRAWDGAKAESFTLGDMDPFYIEICRRIRLNAGRGGDIRVVRATSKGPRIEARKSNGVVGDPWTPVNVKENKSLTLGAGGFTYKRIADYLTPDWQLSPLMELTAAEGRSPRTMQLVARAMVRGQGKTEGYHERIIPFSEKVVARAFGRAGGAEEIGKVAKDRSDQVAIVLRALRRAVSVYAAGGNVKSVGDEHRARANPWANKLDEAVDRDFFHALQSEIEADESERANVRARWLMNGEDGVVDYARKILSDARDSLPCPATQRRRASVRAESVFEGRLRGKDGLPFLFTETHDGGEKCPKSDRTTQP